MADILPTALAAAERAIIEAGRLPFGQDGIVAGQPGVFARAALEAAAPVLAEAVAQKITAHMTEHEPKSRGDLIGGSAAERQRRRTWRRHFGIAARIAAGAFYTDEDKKRLAAEGIERGEFIGCNPEVPDA